MRKSIMFAAILVLAACDDGKSVVPPQSRDSPRQVTLEAVAPDGTHLWAVQIPQIGAVYFSSAGTQRTKNCGKGCSRKEIVPNED